MMEVAEGGIVDPDIREFVRVVNADYERRMAGRDLSMAQRRAIAEDVRAPWRAGGPAMARTEEMRVGSSDVLVRIHWPDKATPLPVLVYLHGGGWTTFSINTHDRLMREYAARAGCAVVGVDYSLSPEVRYPVALEEIEEVLDWLARDGIALGLDPSRAAIGGDSAGANLALASMMRARNRGTLQSRGMLLNYGAFGREHRPSHDRFGGDGYMLTPEEMDWFWTNYLGEDALDDPLATPVHGSFADLPPAFLCIAECDILADENREVAAKLETAGSKVEAKIYRGATHSFLEAMSISDLASGALDDAARWLRGIFAQ